MVILLLAFVRLNGGCCNVIGNENGYVGESACQCPFKSRNCPKLRHPCEGKGDGIGVVIGFHSRQ
jgi:hypothetical protein